jgi:hypothetical protein
MNQQCEFCKRTFQLAEMIETTMMLSLFPVESRAKFCPYCGLDDSGEAANAELVEALQAARWELQGHLEKGTAIPIIGAALARVGAAAEEGE